MPNSTISYKKKFCKWPFILLFRCNESFINWLTVVYQTSKLINYNYGWNAFHYLVDTKGVSTTLASHSLAKAVTTQCS